MQKSLYPLLELGTLGALSGAIGTFYLELGWGDAPRPGIYMVLTGLWFGLVIAFGIWRWSESSLAALVTAGAATWTGWELAVNLALLFERPPLNAILMAEPTRTVISGFASGAVGAFTTWVGAAAYLSVLRNPATAARFASAGALLGLLLPVTNHYDHPAILLVPWQCGIAMLLGLSIVQVPRPVAIQ